ncbi:MAG: ATP-binding protein [Candidatus Promineifilaceae bacterium]
MNQSVLIEESPGNPFIFGRPLEKSDPFFGRHDEISWLRRSVWTEKERRPVAITGSPGIGKTSILNRLIHGTDSRKITTIVIDASQIFDLDGRDFLWRFSQKITKGLASSGRVAPSIQKRMLVLRPMEVFSKKFWIPLAKSMSNERLLVAFDDADVLFSLSGERSSGTEILDIMFRLYKEVETIEFLLVLSDNLRRNSSANDLLFDKARILEIGNFGKQQSLDIIRQSYPRRVADIVGTYIHDLTGGHPNDLQKLCHALYERCLHLGTNHITLADVAVTLAMDLDPSDFQMPVFKRRNIYKYRLPEERM